MDSIPPRKSLGQHWLHDPASLLAMCEAAELNEKDVVLEIGPGLGTLTDLLVKQVSKVIAVELDETLASALPQRIQAANLEIIQEDILRLDFSKLPQGYKIVANIPYYLTSNLIRVLSETSNPPATAVLLLQKEVAERVVAPPGAMSLLSVTAQFYWQADIGQEVQAELFTPPPRVDSQILILKRHPEPLFGNTDPKTFFRLIKAGFAQRRKTLLNNLSGGLQLDREQVKQLCEAAGIDPQRRAQTLSMQEWHKLYETYNT